VCRICAWSTNRDAAGRQVDVLLVGPYPPPFGGVSAHVKRLAAAVEAEGITVGVLNHFHTRNVRPLILGDLHRNPLLYWRALRRVEGGIVHYHHARWSTMIATAIALSRPDAPAAAITVHDRSLDRYLSALTPLGRITRGALRRFDTLIAVSPEIARVLERALPERSIEVIPAYLPVGSDDISARLSRQSRDFLNAGRPTLLVGAYRLMPDASGINVYGLGFALDVFTSLAKDYDTLRLAVFLAHGPRSRAERKHLTRLQERASAAGVSERFRIIVEEALVPAFAYECIFLRPSTTDGDAVAIREALAAGKYVVASDVVARPDGVESLPLQRDAWSAAIVGAINRPNAGPPSEQPSDQARAVIDTYRSLLESRRRRSARMTSVTWSS
jgi:glycosyltransferase involved in cell wall biosynthesis